MEKLIRLLLLVGMLSLPIVLEADLKYPIHSMNRVGLYNLDQTNQRSPKLGWMFFGLSLLFAFTLLIVGWPILAVAIFYAWLNLIILGVMVGAVLWGGATIKELLKKDGIPLWAGLFIILACLLILGWGIYGLFTIWQSNFWAFIATPILGGFLLLFGKIDQLIQKKKE